MKRTHKPNPGRGGIAGVFVDAFGERDSGESSHYLSLSRSAMACSFEAFLRPKDRAFIPAVHEAFGEIDRQEERLSVYRPESAISHLNRAASSGPVQLDPELYQLLSHARDLGLETGGAFDLTTGRLIRCWGFLERSGRIPDADELETARASSGWRNLECDDGARTVCFRSDGTELNLGSIGKGYALDRAAQILRRQGLRDFLLHAGHSSIVASGDSNRGPGWEVGLRGPLGASSGREKVRLEDQAMSTSGPGEQYFVDGGRRYGHILDPRTGYPADRNVLVSVIAPTAMLAEALSTAFFVMESEEVRRYCQGKSDVSAILFSSQKNDSAEPPLVIGEAFRRRED